MGLKLLQRTLRDAEELNERPRMLPTVALCDVRGHRHGCSTNLSGHSVHLFPRESRSYAIASNVERDRVLPNAQIPMVLDGAVLRALNPYSLLATRSSSRTGIPDLRPVVVLSRLLSGFWGDTNMIARECFAPDEARTAGIRSRRSPRGAAPLTCLSVVVTCLLAYLRRHANAVVWPCVAPDKTPDARAGAGRSISRDER
jgi:hypothetical protein